MSNQNLLKIQIQYGTSWVTWDKVSPADLEKSWALALEFIKDHAEDKNAAMRAIPVTTRKK